MDKRLLLLSDDEAEFVRNAIELWSRIYAGDEGPGMQHARVDRFHVLRKLDGKYLPAELQEVGRVALGMID